MTKTSAAKAERTNRVAKNSRIASATIKPGKPKAVPFNEDAVDKADAKQAASLEAKVERNKEFKTIPEQVAESKFYYRNWLWDLGAKFFPHSPKFRHVDYYFPDAVGGPLLVDCSQRLNDSAELIKAKVKPIREAGFRYIVLTYGMGIDEAAERLAKIDSEIGL